MHEYSIVRGIVDIAEKEVNSRGATTVDEIELEIGELSGVEISALEFIWDIAVKDSVLERSNKLINRPAGLAKCIDCEFEFNTSSHFNECPSCQSLATGLIGGKELTVISITIN